MTALVWILGIAAIASPIILVLILQRIGKSPSASIPPPQGGDTPAGSGKNAGTTPATAKNGTYPFQYRPWIKVFGILALYIFVVWGIGVMGTAYPESFLHLVWWAYKKFPLFFWGSQIIFILGLFGYRYDLYSSGTLWGWIFFTLLGIGFILVQEEKVALPSSLVEFFGGEKKIPQTQARVWIDSGFHEFKDHPPYNNMICLTVNRTWVGETVIRPEGCNVTVYPQEGRGTATSVKNGQKKTFRVSQFGDEVCIKITKDFTNPK